MKRPKWYLLVAALSALALVAAACGDDDGDGVATRDCTWTIGTIGALSGDFATIGVPISQGIEYAVDQANEAGELECELNLRREDSQGSPDQAPPLAQALVETEDLVAIVGPYFSGETLATGAIYGEANVPFVCPSCTNETINDQGFTTFFRGVGHDGVQGPSAATYIDQVLNAETVATVHDNQDYSKGLAETVHQQLRQAGVNVAGPFVINPEETDYSAVVSRVNNANPDVVYYGGYVPQAPQLLRQLRDAGVEAQFVSDDGAKDASFGELAGDAAEGAIVTCPCVDPLAVEGAQSFVDGMREAYGPEAPGTFATDAFDVTNLVITALRDASADDSIEDIRNRVLEFLQNADGEPGIAKSYTFDETGELQIDPDEAIWLYEWSTDEDNFVSIGPVAELI